MASYQITNRRSGASMGTYEADDEAGALAAMAVDAGSDEPIDAARFIVRAMTGAFRIVPVTNRSDYYAAGFDGNWFATEEEARAAIENLCATDSAFGEPSEWTVIEMAA